MKTVNKLWNDECGFVLSVELVLISTIAVIGLLAGITAIRDAVISEMSDVAGAVQDLNQSYSYFGVTGHSAATSGASFTDELDYCDSSEDTAAEVDNCIVIEDQNINDEGTGVAPSNP